MLFNRTYLLSFPSLNTCNAILVTLIDMTQNGKFCISSCDNIYTKVATFEVFFDVTKYNVVNRPSMPQPRRSVVGSVPIKISIYVFKYLGHKIKENIVNGGVI